MSIETVSTYMENVIDSNVNRSRNLQAVFALPAARRAAPRYQLTTFKVYLQSDTIVVPSSNRDGGKLNWGGSLLSFNKGSFHRSTAI